MKFNDAEVIGIPLTIIIGDRTLESKEIEIKGRQDEKPKLVSHHDLLANIVD